MDILKAKARYWCENLEGCPGVFFLPAYLNGCRCPNCGSLCHPEGNGRNGGPMLYSYEDVEAYGKAEDHNS